jgi:hypothetical protein
MASIKHIEPHFSVHAASDPIPPETASGDRVATPGNPALRWLLHDLPYITMMVLALTGVILRLPFNYWVVLIPVFGVISTAEGWRRTSSRDARLGLVCQMALTWCALLLAIFLLFNGSVKGVLNANATSLTMLTLLALGVFTAGVQAKEWRISAVGTLLFLAVPGLGWLDQSPLLMSAATVLVIAIGGLTWWITQAKPA